MVNIAEEVIEPEKNMPKGIIIVLIVSTLFYMLIALIAVFAVPMDVLLVSKAPFTDMVKINSDIPVWVITSISLFAVVNGALIQIIMSSRLLYGMSRQEILPEFFSAIHPVTRVPHKSTLFVTLSILLLTLVFDLEVLAKMTSYIVIFIFITMSLTLIIVKRKAVANNEDYQSFSVPMIVPIFGFVISIGFLMMQFL